MKAFDTVHAWPTVLCMMLVLGQRGLGFRRLALRLDALSTHVQKLSREIDTTKMSRDDLSLLLQRYSAEPIHHLLDCSMIKIQTQYDTVSVALYAYGMHAVQWSHISFCLFPSFRQDQQGLARLVERELKRVSQRLDQLSHHHHQSHTPSPHDNHKLHTGNC